VVCNDRSRLIRVVEMCTNWNPSMQFPIIFSIVPSVISDTAIWWLDICIFSPLYLRFISEYKIGPCHSYFGMCKGNCTKAFEWHQFQWPWMTRNPDFKVTALFDAEYLRNGTRYRYTYNGILIATYTRPIQGCHFEWPWISYLVKYSVTRSIARSFCDSCASYVLISGCRLLRSHQIVPLHRLRCRYQCVLPSARRWKDESALMWDVYFLSSVSPSKPSLHK